MQNTFRKAFTLSEILLVLSVIGVIAALTIPTLLQKSNDKQYQVKFKKAYSIISQATTLIIVNDGLWDSSDSATRSTNMRNAYAKYISFILTDTMANIMNSYYVYYKNSFGIGISLASEATVPSAIAADGTAYEFNSYANCATVMGSYFSCGWIHVDVNGKAGPNMMGKDEFSLWVLRDSGGTVLAGPMGGPYGDGKSCVANASTYPESEGCAAAALSDTLP